MALYSKVERSILVFDLPNSGACSPSTFPTRVTFEPRTRTRWTSNFQYIYTLLNQASIRFCNISSTIAITRKAWIVSPPSFPSLQQKHKSAGIASCCIREAARRHTPSSSGLLPFPRPVPSPDDPFPPPRTPPPRPICTRPSFYFCNRVSLCFARRPRSRANPFASTPFPFHP